MAEGPSKTEEVLQVLEQMFPASQRTLHWGRWIFPKEPTLELIFSDRTAAHGNIHAGAQGTVRKKEKQREMAAMDCNPTPRSPCVAWEGLRGLECRSEVEPGKKRRKHRGF